MLSPMQGSSPEVSGAKAAFSVAEFCAAYGISRDMFDDLRKSGRAPVIMKIGRRVLVSVQAAEDWRKRLEAEASAVA
jgi:hypothetical protein